jgi:hypothetical protein
MHDFVKMSFDLNTLLMQINTRLFVNHVQRNILGKEIDQKWSQSKVYINVLPKNTKNIPQRPNKNLANVTFQPRNEHFWLPKHVFFIPTTHTDIHKHI